MESPERTAWTIAWEAAGRFDNFEEFMEWAKNQQEVQIFYRHPAGQKAVTVEPIADAVAEYKPSVYVTTNGDEYTHISENGGSRTLCGTYAEGIADRVSEEAVFCPDCVVPECPWIIRPATLETPDEYCGLPIECVGDDYCPDHQHKADEMADREEGADGIASDEQWAEALALLDTSRCPYPLSKRMVAALASRDPETIREAAQWDLSDDDGEAPTLKAADWLLGELTRMWEGRTHMSYSEHCHHIIGLDPEDTKNHVMPCAVCGSGAHTACQHVPY
jgi:hypothetical protein